MSQHLRDTAKVASGSFIKRLFLDPCAHHLEGAHVYVGVFLYNDIWASSDIFSVSLAGFGIVPWT